MRGEVGGGFTAYRFLYRAADKTLKQNEVDEAHKRILDLLGKIPYLAFR